MKRKLKRFCRWMMQDMPTVDQVITYICILLVLGSFGAWECQIIPLSQTWAQIAAFAFIGYVFGIYGWREVVDFVCKLVFGLSRSLQRLSKKTVRRQKNVQEMVRKRKAS